MQYWDSWWWTVNLSETRRVLYQYKIENSCILLVFIIRIYHDAGSFECQIPKCSFTELSRLHMLDFLQISGVKKPHSVSWTTFRLWHTIFTALQIRKVYSSVAAQIFPTILFFATEFHWYIDRTWKLLWLTYKQDCFSLDFPRTVMLKIFCNRS